MNSVPINICNECRICESSNQFYFSFRQEIPNTISEEICDSLSESTCESSYDHEDMLESSWHHRCIVGDEYRTIYHDPEEYVSGTEDDAQSDEDSDICQ